MCKRTSQIYSRCSNTYKVRKIFIRHLKICLRNFENVSIIGHLNFDASSNFGDIFLLFLIHVIYIFELPYQCSHCMKRFQDRSGLYRHMIKNHRPPSKVCDKFINLIFQYIYSRYQITSPTSHYMYIVNISNSSVLLAERISH